MILLSKYKGVLIAAALVGSAGTGWVANGWRLGKKIEATKVEYFQAKARRGEDFANTMAQAAKTASSHITEAQALLKQARAAKALALAETAAKAPKGPQFDCLNTPLPDDYLETFRK